MYSLDTNSARKADTSGSSIKELGKYIGDFTQAKEIIAKSGTKGIEFAFKSASGQKANLSIYTMSASGEKYQGYDTLMAIMTCMSLKNIAPTKANVTRYDYDQKKDVQEPGTVFADLHKPIGVLLETEDYLKQDGSTGTRMVLKNVFRAADEFTASEILDRKTKPELLPKMVAGLRHRPLKGAREHIPSGYPAMRESSGGFADMDDDIPF